MLKAVPVVRNEVSGFQVFRLILGKVKIRSRSKNEMVRIVKHISIGIGLGFKSCMGSCFSPKIIAHHALVV